MNKEEFIIEIEKLGIKPTKEQLNNLEIYCNFLLEKNKVVNLTAIKEEDGVYLKHFYDSLTIIKSIDLSKYNNLIDVGTGAGFPGMVLKIMYPHLEVTLLDSNNKKLQFLEELSNKLNLNNIHFVHERSEEYYLKVKDSFDIVVARAVSNLRVLSEICLPLVKEGGYFISLKGDAEEEIKEAKETIELLNGIIEDINKFKLIIEDSNRTIIKIKKNKNLVNYIPRRYDKITKTPLKKIKK